MVVVISGRGEGDGCQSEVPVRGPALFIWIDMNNIVIVFMVVFMLPELPDTTFCSGSIVDLIPVLRRLASSHLPKLINTHTIYICVCLCVQCVCLNAIQTCFYKYTNYIITRLIAPLTSTMYKVHITYISIEFSKEWLLWHICHSSVTGIPVRLLTQVWRKVDNVKETDWMLELSARCPRTYTHILILFFPLDFFIY